MGSPVGGRMTTPARKILVLDSWKPSKILHTFIGAEEMGQWLRDRVSVPGTNVAASNYL